MSRKFLARRTVLSLALMCASLVVFCAAAFAAVRTGTDGSEVLVGTGDADQITGMGGDDTTRGKGGSDTYFYADGWGKDTLTDPEGTDALDFSDTKSDLTIYLCPDVPQVGDQEVGGQAYDELAAELNRVDFDSYLENARGGSGDDTIYGCSGPNKLSGGGGDDVLADLGGFDLPNMLDLPKSNDRYWGFRPGSGRDFVADAGGREDVLDMRAFGSGDVDLFRFDFAATLPGGQDPDGVADSLLVKTGPDRGVGVANYFASDDYFAHYNGRVEKILFKDKTISPQDAPPLPDGSALPIAERSSAPQAGGKPAGEGLPLDLSD